MSLKSLTSQSTIKKELIAARKILKNKVAQIRKHRQHSEDLLHSGFKYLVEPIKAAIDIKNEIKHDIKDEMQNEINDEIKQDFQTSIIKQSAPRKMTTSSPVKESPKFVEIAEEYSTMPDEDDEVFLHSSDPEISIIPTENTTLTTEEQHETTIADLRDMYATRQGRLSMDGFFRDQQVGEIASKYLKLMLTAGADLDYTYGVRWSPEDNRWMLGTLPFEVSNDYITLDLLSIKGTEGLFQLIFLKTPNKEIYTSDDLENYKRILRVSNAHKRNYGAGNLINRNQSFKYKEIISKLFPPRQRLTYPTRSKASGTGLFKQVTFKPDYIYWDSINELVDRLRLLYASKVAGNNSVNNEIISIIEELREAKIIA